MKKTILRILTVVCLLLLGIFIFKFLSNQKKLPAPKKQKLIPLVETIVIKTNPQQITFSAQGVIEAQEIGSLTPQISGKIIYLSEQLKPGGSIEKNQLLAKIDARDYELALEKAKNNLKIAENQLILAQANSQQAIKTYQLLHGENASVPSLIAKEPDLKQALANKNTALNNLLQAELNLKRTQLFAPYKLTVLSKDVGIGDYVSPGQKLATYYKTDSLEIKVPFEPEKLSYLENKSKAYVFIPSLNTTLKATLLRTGPNIDESTRLINLYFKIPQANLKPGEFVQLTIMGKTINHVAKVPRESVHDLNTIWLLTPKKEIEIRKIKVIGQEENHLLVTGLKTGEEIIITPLGEVKSGLKVRVK